MRKGLRRRRALTRKHTLHGKVNPVETLNYFPHRAPVRNSPASSFPLVSYLFFLKHRVSRTSSPKIPLAKLTMRMRRKGGSSLPSRPRLCSTAAIFLETFIRQRTGLFFLKGKATAQKISPFCLQDLAALGSERPPTGKWDQGGAEERRGYYPGLRKTTALVSLAAP